MRINIICNGNYINSGIKSVEKRHAMKINWKGIVVTILVSLIVIGLTLNALQSERYKEDDRLSVSKEYSEKSMINQPKLPGYQLITGNPSRGIFIYGKKLDSQPYFQQVLVRTQTAQKIFNWKATTKNPVLTFADITGSGEQNIIIIFVTAYGTGLLESQVHILNKALTKEIPVENPVLASQRLITSRIDGQDIVFRAGGKEYRVRPSVGPGGIQEAYNNIQFGSIVNYRVENNKLLATVSLDTGSSAILGEFTLQYSYAGGKLLPQVIGFRRIS